MHIHAAEFLISVGGALTLLVTVGAKLGGHICIRVVPAPFENIIPVSTN